MEARDVTLAFVGDLFVRRAEPESMFYEAAERIRQVDIACGNLEGTISNVGAVADVKRSGRRLNVMDESAIKAFAYAGFDVVSLANNNPMNLGGEGLRRTIELLGGAGIAHAGAGENLEAARRPAILERGGMRFAYLSYSSVFDPTYAATADSPGLAPVRVSTSFEPQPRHNEVPGSPPIIRTHPHPRDTAAMLEDVRKAKEQADFVAVSWHWGISSANGGAFAGQVLEYQTALGHAAIDAGADVVAGHHPHVLEGIEVYRGRPIFYSLGNFAFDDHPSRPRPTVMACCTVRQGSIRELSCVPVRLTEEHQPVPIGADSEEGRGLVEELGALCSPYGVTVRPRGDDILLVGPEDR